MTNFDYAVLLAERRRRRRHPDKPGIGYLPFPNLTRVHRIAQQASCQRCQRWRYRREDSSVVPLAPDTPVVIADVPYAAGPSAAGSRIYIDPAIPASLMVGAIEIDLHYAVALHERVEYVLMHDFGMSYADAHVIATAVEYNYVAQCGADVAEYERLVAPYVHQARANADRGGTDVPDDLDLTPYTDEGEVGLVADSVSAIAYGSRSKWQQDADRHGYAVVPDGDELYAVQFDPAGQAVYVGWSPSSEVGYLDPDSGYPSRDNVRTGIRENWLNGHYRAECVFALNVLAAARALVGNSIEESAVKLAETAVQSYFKRAGMQVQMDGDYVTVWTSTDKDYWDATQIYQGLGPQASDLSTVEDGDLFGIRFKLDQTAYPPNGDLASKPSDYDNVPTVKPGENKMPENKPGTRLEATGVVPAIDGERPAPAWTKTKAMHWASELSTAQRRALQLATLHPQFWNQLHWMAKDTGVDSGSATQESRRVKRESFGPLEVGGRAAIYGVDADGIGAYDGMDCTVLKIMRNGAVKVRLDNGREILVPELDLEPYQTMDGRSVAAAASFESPVSSNNQTEADSGGLEVMDRNDMEAFGGAGIPAAGPALIGWVEGNSVVLLALDDDDQIRVECRDAVDGSSEHGVRFYKDDADGYREAKAYAKQLASNNQ